MSIGLLMHASSCVENERQRSIAEVRLQQRIFQDEAGSCPVFAHSARIASQALCKCGSGPTSEAVPEGGKHEIPGFGTNLARKPY
jgi:hypothetical protein